jgi:hypothetical protein
MWKYSGAAGWSFVTLPEELSNHIRMAHGTSESGWGRLKVEARIRDQVWSTSIWFDTKLSRYLLPLNKKVRDANQIQVGSKVVVQLSMHDGLFM